MHPVASDPVLQVYHEATSAAVGGDQGAASDGQRRAVEGQTKGVEDADAASSRGLQNRPDVGVEAGAPFRPEAVGDLAEDDAGPQSLLGAVVGRRNGAVGDENEQVLAEPLDDALQLLPRLGGGNDRQQQGVEALLEPGVIGHQGGVGQTGASPSDPYGPLQQAHDAGREAIVTGVNGVLGVAQQMGRQT